VNAIPAGQSYIVYKQHTYSLNPAIPLCTDVDTFLTYYQQGQQQEEKRIFYYERACHLYTGPFLVEDLYADWSSLQRESLCRTYLAMCNVLARHYFQVQCYQEAEFWATAMLKENKCDEEVHRLLIQMYAAQGRRHDALQQYRTCEHILLEELGVKPLPETRSALRQLLSDEILAKRKNRVEIEIE
jgi:DNA-binding SARP family transcriptional activator